MSRYSNLDAVRVHNRALVEANRGRRRQTPWWWPFRTRLTERGYLLVLVVATLPAYGVLAYIINTR